MDDFTIYNSMRYGKCDKFPHKITCHDSTVTQAQELAEWMSSYYPGQEEMFLVLGFED